MQNGVEWKMSEGCENNKKETIGQEQKWGFLRQKIIFGISLLASKFQAKKLIQKIFQYWTWCNKFLFCVLGIIKSFTQGSVKCLKWWGELVVVSTSSSEELGDDNLMIHEQPTFEGQTWNWVLTSMIYFPEETLFTDRKVRKISI